VSEVKRRRRKAPFSSEHKPSGVFFLFSVTSMLCTALSVLKIG
jgi:hypothetical protein